MSEHTTNNQKILIGALVLLGLLGYFGIQEWSEKQEFALKQEYILERRSECKELGSARVSEDKDKYFGYQVELTQSRFAYNAEDDSCGYEFVRTHYWSYDFENPDYDNIYEIIDLETKEAVVFLNDPVDPEVRKAREDYEMDCLIYSVYQEEYFGPSKLSPECYDF